MYTTIRNRTARKEGFSLYELLIVVTVVLILVAITVPVTQRVRAAASATQCINNLRSWGIAFQLYTADNNGFYPLGWINNSDHWCSIMAPYVEESWLSYEGPPTFAKRMDRNKAGCTAYAKFVHPEDPMFRAFPYSYNSARFDYPYANPASHVKGTPLWPAGWRAGMNWDPYGVAHRYNSMELIGPYTTVPPSQLYTKPAECVTMFCGVAACWRYMSFPYAWWFSGGGGADWDVKTGDCAAHWNAYVTDANGIKAFDYNGAPTGIHGGRDNYLFMDGHVQTLELSNPDLSRYVFNQIPNNNNPYK